jgi:hypothetical protein
MKHALLTWLASAATALSMAGTDQLVGEYEPIEERPGWPKGVHEVLLDPTRKVGWRSWFSELPNDGEQYAFAVRTTRDLQRLLDAFAKVDDPKKRFAINPGRGPRGLGDWRPTAKGREWAAVLGFSNRDLVAKYNQRELQRGEPIVHQGSPTTLTVYLGSANIDLFSLQLPDKVTIVTAESSPVQGAEYSAQVEKIKEFKARRFSK